MKWLKRLFKRKKVKVVPTEQLKKEVVSNTLLQRQVDFHTNILKWKYGIEDD
jgi:hypothetical protein